MLNEGAQHEFKYFQVNRELELETGPPAKFFNFYHIWDHELDFLIF